jgi:SWI/SNF-related matrix-associated actin-dependent regulator 1 of chromatin subfamily A
MELDEMLFGVPAKVLPSITHLPPLSIGLLPHQEEAVRFVLEKGSAYLALDMGLGKTATAISVIAAAKTVGESPALVIVPPSLRHTWQEEIKKFAPFLTVEVLKGMKTHKLKPADVYIIGDATVDAWTQLPTEDPFTLIGKIKTLVVDEAHREKTPSSSRTRAVIRLASTITNYRVLMSGTPTPNGRNQEMGSQLDILGDDAWAAIGGKGKFYTYYCPVLRDDNGKLNKFGKRANNDSLGLNAAMIENFMMRKRRFEVLDLPSKGRTSIHIEGQGKAVKDYLLAEESLVAYLAGEGKDWRAAARNEALVKLTTMRKLAGVCKAKGIIDRTKELLNDTLPKGHGVFIVAEHHDLMDKLRIGLEKYGVVAFNGLMDDEEKKDAVKAFTSGKARVLVGQIMSVGVGLTLHGDGINHHVLVAQLPWSPAALMQAEDRLHRIGQTNDVDVEICVASINGSWTIDERLWAILENKAFSSGEIIDGKGEFLLEEVQDGIIDSYR